MTTLSSLFSGSSSSRYAPYNAESTKPITLKLVAIPENGPQKSSFDNNMRYMYVGVADQTGAAKMSVDDQHIDYVLQNIGKTIILKNYVVKNQQIYLNKQSKIFTCSDVSVDEETEQTAHLLVNPASTQTTLDDAKKDGPTTKLKTVVATITKVCS